MSNALAKNKNKKKSQIQFEKAKMANPLYPEATFCTTKAWK